MGVTTCTKKLAERSRHKNKRALSYGGWIGIGSNDLWPTEIILYWKYARQVLNSWKTGVKNTTGTLRCMANSFYVLFVCESGLRWMVRLYLMDLQTLTLTFLFLKVKLINFHPLHICVIYTAFLEQRLSKFVYPVLHGDVFNY